MGACIIFLEKSNSCFFWHTSPLETLQTPRCIRCSFINSADACLKRVDAALTATEQAALAAEAALADALAEAPPAAASALALEAARPAPINADRACDLPAAPPALQDLSKGVPCWRQGSIDEIWWRQPKDWCCNRS